MGMSIRMLGCCCT